MFEDLGCVTGRVDSGLRHGNRHSQLCDGGGRSKMETAKEIVEKNAKAACLRLVDYRFVESQFIDYFCASITYSQPQTV